MTTYTIPVADVRSIPNPALTPYVKKILSLLKPMDVKGKELVRKGREYDGGYVMLNHKLENSICYSMGISNDDSWDMDMVKIGCEVYQYDHTIDKFPHSHPKFHSNKIGICSQPSGEDNLKTINELLEINCHINHNDIIMKMDIEGAEWPIFEEIESDILSKFSQIVVEMHSFLEVHHGHIAQKYISILNKLAKTHQVVHIHSNNCGPIALVGGIMLPDTFEVSFARNKDHAFSECKKVFPTSLDMPCDLAKPDYFLGAMGLY
jgi:hypothetical protein